MSIADELRKLEELRRSGALSDEEFAQAKAAVLGGTSRADVSAGQDRSLFPINPSDGLTPRSLRILQIIAVALLLGVVTFLGFVLYIVQVQHSGKGAMPDQAVPILTLIAVGFLAACTPLAFIFPTMITRGTLRQMLARESVNPPYDPEEMHPTGGSKLWEVRQTTMIVGLALLEGTAFTGCIAYLMDANPLALGVVAVAVFLMLGKFPTEQRVRAWLERQAAELNRMHEQDVQYGRQ
jgi:hypothetical protein